MKKKKSKVPKIPKAGTCKRIEWELKRQGAFSRDTEDGAVFFVDGDFFGVSVRAFNNKWRFHAEPITSLAVVKQNRRLKEEMRFGCENVYGWFTLGKCAKTLNFIFNKSYGLHGSDSRYIAITNFHGSRKNFFYMDRVI